MSYFAPIIAFGRLWPKTVIAGQEPLAGTKVIGVDNSDDHYAVGDPLFISQADDTAIEFLGEIKEIAANKLSLTVECALVATKTAGALLWRPQTCYRFTKRQRFQEKLQTLTGVKSRITRGGRIFTTLVADPQVFLTFDWARGNLDDFQAVDDFVRNERQQGLLSFTLAYYDHLSQAARVDKAVFMMTLPFADDSGAGIIGETLSKTRGKYDFCFFIEAAGTYVDA